MLGETVTDPEGVERDGSALGLGLLPIHTSMRTEKVTRSASGILYANTLFGQQIATEQVAGYEIHVGETHYAAHARPFATLAMDVGNDTQWDGCVSDDGHVMGTYLHGVFDEDSFRHAFLLAARAFAELSSDVVLTGWKAKREESLNRLAAEVSKAVDLRTIFSWVGQEYAAGVRKMDEGEGAG
jgi:adenosylcobyric acid synthase